MSRIPPPPREIDTAEEVAAYYRDVEREIDLNQPGPGEY